MAIPIRLILLIGVIEFVSGQYSHVDVEPLQQKSTAGPRLTGRFVPRQNTKNGNLPGISSKIRRPLPLRTRPVTSDSIEIPSFNHRNTRPVFIPSPTPRESSTQHPPSSPPSPPPQQDQPQQVKPVSEEHEDEQDDVAQAIANLGAVSNPPSHQHHHQHQQHQQQQQQSGPHFPSFFPLQSTPRPEPQIFQYRPNLPRPPPQQESPRPSQHQFSEQNNVQPLQYRQQKPLPVKHRKPTIEEAPEVRIPIKQNQLASVKKTASAEYRGKKPVAQIIRRWREDNEDGSITWGFENDDGSYKEEVIGIDCITRGKYGYVDPDGVRREYTYETGIKCDEEQQQETEDNGFVDYQENKLVLPNGRTIDLSSMGKKQARRPGPIYRN